MRLDTIVKYNFLSENIPSENLVQLEEEFQLEFSFDRKSYHISSICCLFSSGILTASFSLEYESCLSARFSLSLVSVEDVMYEMPGLHYNILIINVNKPLN